MPLDILGQIYERFLGKIIVVNGKKAAIEEKPEVRKAGGVYYTPSYIVNYIVAQTVGKLLETRSPTDKEKIKILDPACGSGSFLLGAYDYLLKWHLQWYRDNEPQKWAQKANPPIYQTIAPYSIEAQYRLTARERKRIVLDHIYGVDLDAQAVEVTKLSLALKVLEGETAENIDNALKNHNERGLPDLGANIKCGNSLIGPDFYSPKDSEEWTRRNALSDEERARINDFNWRTEFPAVFKSGGFDVAVGNPPYGAEISPEIVAYLLSEYKTSHYQLDTYSLFIEKTQQMMKTQGKCGFIIPSAWIASKYDRELRELLVTQTELNTVAIAPRRVFQDASVETLILIFTQRQSVNNETEFQRWDSDAISSYRMAQSEISAPDYNIPAYSFPPQTALIAKMRNGGEVLKEHATAVWGVKIYQRGKGKPKQNGSESALRKFHSVTKTTSTHRPLLGGSEVKRYSLNWKGGFVDYGEWLAEPRSLSWFQGERILVREITANGAIQAVLTNEDYVFSNSVDGVKINADQNALFYLGLLNSKLISFFHANTSANAFKETFPKVLIKDLLNLPLPKADKTQHDQIVQLVETMLQLHADLPDANGAQKSALEKRIATTDGQIDALVYRIYGLSDAEIALVEGA